MSCARWGTWGARAAKFINLFNPMPIQLLYFEPGPSATVIKSVHALNNITGDIEVVQDKARADKFIEWASKFDHIDLLDIDIQGGDFSLVPEIMPILIEKLYRIVIGTHSIPGHVDLLA